jgi:Flp pilus assembly pilin Flp
MARDGWQDRRGVSAVEYALIGAVVITVLAGVLPGLSARALQLFQSVAAALTR